MKIIFFGLGSIGTRHARLLKENFNHELYAFRYNKDSKENMLGIKEIFSFEELDEIKPDVAFITNPTYKHMECALQCAKRGMNLFIEKPLSNTQEGLKEFKQIVKEKKIKTYLAYNMRFNQLIKWLKENLQGKKPVHVSVYASSFLPNWRKNIDHLKNYSALKEQGGGIVLDLSHEIDYLYYLFGKIKKVKVNSKKISDVTVDSEDFADILLEFDSGMFGNVHLNFLSRLNRREIIIDLNDSTVTADLISNKITIYDDKGTNNINFNFERDDMYLSELKYFFEHMRTKKTMNDINESLRIFNIIMKIKNEVKL
ncbi:MAG: Gfo/Idh/MocA family oxidoreductase [Candidatus Woesearchaeota archaeon]|nr:Gfo/Idh/MocA family oxidoreductase [Candidatus Woesearchaeota archaeon]